MSNVENNIEELYKYVFRERVHNTAAQLASNQCKVMIVPWSLGPCFFSPGCLLPWLVKLVFCASPSPFYEEKEIGIKISQRISRPRRCGLLWMGANKGAEARENQGKLVTTVCRVAVFQENLIKNTGV